MDIVSHDGSNFKNPLLLNIQILQQIQDKDDIHKAANNTIELNMISFLKASLSAMMVPQTPTMYLAPQYSYPQVSP